MALIEAEGISKSFGGLKALDNVSLAIEQRQIVGIIGPNGAGKTTLFNVVSGFLPPDEGHIYYRSKDITKLPPHRMPQIGVARTWQGVRLVYKLTALDNVLLGIPRQKGENIFFTLFASRRVAREESENMRKALYYLDMVHLADKADELTQNLSYAEQKLVSLARLLATEAELFLLDEPTSGMDIASVESVMFPAIRQLAEKQGKTVCIVEHSIDLIRSLCQWVFFLDQGSLIAEGTPDQLISDPNLSRIYFGS